MRSVAALPRGAWRRMDLRSSLLKWFDREKRAMPWRGTKDPYQVWLSEVMLQQTRVETVTRYWGRFLDRFPSVRALAEASEQDVLKAWEGLGYYRRARHLHRAAQEVVERHHGVVPSDEEAFRALPGVGDYTAGAVLSIAFGKPLPAVDGNVIRVLCRLHNIVEAPTRPETAARIRSIAADLVHRRRAGDWTQALMELGAIVCLPREPRCLLCPVARSCQGRAAGTAARLPVRAPKKAPHRWEHACAVVRRRGRLLLVRRPEEGLLGGMWELPSGELDGEALDAAVPRILAQTTGLSATYDRELGSVDHAFTHARLTLRVCTVRETRGRLRSERAAWCAPGDVARLPLSVVARKSLDLVETIR